jgi:hypothetical protein
VPPTTDANLLDQISALPVPRAVVRTNSSTLSWFFFLAIFVAVLVSMLYALRDLASPDIYYVAAPASLVPLFIAAASIRKFRRELHLRQLLATGTPTFARITFQRETGVNIQSSRIDYQFEAANKIITAHATDLTGKLAQNSHTIIFFNPENPADNIPYFSTPYRFPSLYKVEE